MPKETEREDRSRLSLAAAPREPHIFVVLSGERPGAGGLRSSLTGLDEVHLGRTESPSVERRETRLLVGLADPKASSRHARLRRIGGGVAGAGAPDGGWLLEDEHSTNGTFVNGTRTKERALHDGDVIEAGRTILRVRFALPTPEESPPVTAADETLGSPTLLPALAAEHRVLVRVAASPVPVLLLGETGTGKEVLCRAIHSASQRPGPLVAVNCAALPDTLVESQFFGHVKGAFSGAEASALGFVRAADKGTLFLDEVADLPPAAQGVLLRVLQEGEVVPVGGTRPIAVDVRVVAATHQPIGAMVERGTFRRDLFARLRGFSHSLWPLHERREDVGVLVASILRSLGKADGVRLSADAARALVLYEWPFNVRELGQALSRALALATRGTIGAAELPPALTGSTGSVSGAAPQAESAAPASLSPRDVALRAELLSRLERCQGNVAAVAREMERAPMQVYRWMRRLGVDPRSFR
jgi:transcriptional regulator of acetoin/glycerol metabolism